MADTNRGYWSRSWALLTMHEGWIKPVLALAAARLVPIVGPFGAEGYALEWGRLTAWGVDAAPKQKGVDIGACIVSGARAFVIALGYGIVLALLNGMVSTVLGEALGGLLVILIGACFAILVIVAKLRATIYQSVGAGYQVNRIADMVKRDSNGLLRLVGLSAAIYAVIGFVAAIVFTIVLLVHAGPFVAQLIELDDAAYVSDARMVRMVFTMLGSMLPTLFVLGFLLSVVNTVASLILTTAAGLWMRQFDVQHWGQSADPLPGTGAPVGAAVTPEYPQGGAYGGSAYGEPAPTQAPGEPAGTGWMPVETPAPTQATDEGLMPVTTPTAWTEPQPQAESAVPLWPVEPESQVADAETGVPSFTLDEFASEAAAAAVEPVAEEVPTFSLDGLAPVEGVGAEPAQEPAPVPESYQGPVENDEDARRALASLDLPVRPFERMVGEAEEEAEPTVVDVVDLTAMAREPESVAEPEAVAEVEAEPVAEEVPTFSLDDVAAPEEGASEE